MSLAKFINIDEIEYKYNLEFISDVRNKYHNDIITIFNDDLSNYSMIEINDPEINIILAIYYNTKGNTERAINILIGVGDYPRALCTLGILYKQSNNDKSLECFKKAANMGDKNAINNLAFQYYLMRNIDMFEFYNNMLEDDNKYINLALFELNINNNYNIALEYIIKACSKTSILNHRAYYIYANDFLLNNNNNEYYKNLFLGFKIKPKKQHIETLIKNTIPEFRYLLCHKYDYPIELFGKYDESILNLNCQIIINKVCPVCLNKDTNIKLKCMHTFCESCMIKHKKCILCRN